MKTILIAVVIVILAVLGWNWYQSQGAGYSSGADNYDVNSSHTPLVSPDQSSGIYASGSLQGTVH